LGHSSSNSWHPCATFGCPHPGSTRHGCGHWGAFVPHLIGGVNSVLPQVQINGSNEASKHVGQGPRWHNTVQLWDPHFNGLPQILVQRWSPEQHWAPQWCREQLFMEVQTRSQRSSCWPTDEQGRENVLWLQRHLVVTRRWQGGQSSRWQVDVQVWPQGRSLEHGLVQTGMGSSQVVRSMRSVTRVFPHGQNLTFSGERGQDTISGSWGWHPFSQAWIPQSNFLLSEWFSKREVPATNVCALIKSEPRLWPFITLYLTCFWRCFVGTMNLFRMVSTVTWYCFLDLTWWTGSLVTHHLTFMVLNFSIWQCNFKSITRQRIRTWLSTRPAWWIGTEINTFDQSSILPTKTCLRRLMNLITRWTRSWN